MRIKTYIKQAWTLLRQNRLFSTLYIVGTALAIAMTMMMAVIYYVRLAPVYPEERRATTLYMGGLKLSQTFDCRRPLITVVGPGGPTATPTGQ